MNRRRLERHGWHLVDSSWQHSSAIEKFGRELASSSTVICLLIILQERLANAPVLDAHNFIDRSDRAVTGANDFCGDGDRNIVGFAPLLAIKICYSRALSSSEICMQVFDGWTTTTLLSPTARVF